MVRANVKFFGERDGAAIRAVNVVNHMRGGIGFCNAIARWGRALRLGARPIPSLKRGLQGRAAVVGIDVRAAVPLDRKSVV